MRIGLLAPAVSLMLLVGGCHIGSHASNSQAATVFKSPLGPYGEAYSYPADSTMTDGNTIFELVKGPVRILSIAFQDSGSKAEVLGVRIRPIGGAVIPFDSATRFPPDASIMTGTSEAKNAVLDGPSAGQPFSAYELIIGYHMPAAGRYFRTSIVIKYEYANHIATLTHPSWIALCAGQPGSPCAGRESG